MNTDWSATCVICLFGVPDTATAYQTVGSHVEPPDLRAARSCRTSFGGNVRSHGGEDVVAHLCNPECAVGHRNATCKKGFTIQAAARLMGVHTIPPVGRTARFSVHVGFSNVQTVLTAFSGGFGMSNVFGSALMAVMSCREMRGRMTEPINGIVVFVRSLE